MGTKTDECQTADASDRAAAEISSLQGTWQLISAVTNGNETVLEAGSNVRVVIKNGSHTVYFGDTVVAKEIPFAVNPNTNPATTVDTLPDGRKIRGIYKLEGDTLITCVGEIGKESPAHFVSTPGSGHTLRAFRRIEG